MLSLAPASLALALVLLLWSSDIGPEAEQPAPPPPAAVAVAPGTGTGHAPAKLAGDHTRRAPLPLDPDASLDRRAFLAAFRRQAETDLLPCLRDWEHPPNAVTVAATLSRSGVLLHLTSLDPTRPLPECATQAVAAMRFTSLAARLTRPTVSLQWRIDW